MATMTAKPPRDSAFGIGSNKAPEGVGGVIFAVVLVLVICGLGLLIGQIVTSAIIATVPNAQPWLVLLFSVLALVPLLLIAARVFPWLTSWYYLIPALVALLAFTVYPIAMTGYYAFTNFSASNSGRPDSSTEIGVAVANERGLRLNADSSLDTLRCLTPNCAGEQLELRPAEDTGRPGAVHTVTRAEGTSIEFSSVIPADTASVRRINAVQNIGFGNFSRIFGEASTQLWPVFIWNVVFAFGTTALNVVVGLLLGILLNNKRLKFRNLYRSLLILPWAVPGLISILMWAQLLRAQGGAINRLLIFLGVDFAIPWLEDGLWAKAAILLVNLWLGFPYMMTATLGALAAIPEELYEAADVDGATRWHQIRFITLPMLSAAFIPITLSAFAFNFNNFSIIYLLTNGGPAERVEGVAKSTDILLSWGYKLAFSSGQDGGQAYGLASAVAVVVGILTIGISIVNFRFAGVFKEAKR
jgi:arabinogalactan oligomer / maltooligosaccharide transport system permease protein